MELKNGSNSAIWCSVSVLQINLRFKNQVEKFNLYFEGTIFSATDLFNRIDILEIDSNGVVLLIKVGRC
jgi:hypothetical protein